MAFLDRVKSMVSWLFKPSSGSSGSASACVSCDFGETKIVLLETRKTKTDAEIFRFHEMPRPPEGEEGAKLIRQAFSAADFKSQRIRIAIKGYGVVVRFIQFPKMKPDELKSAIFYEAEKYIPFKAEEVLLDYCVLDEEVTMSSGAKGMNLLLVAVKKDEIHRVIQIFQSAGLTVELIDVNALAFLTALEFFHKNDFQFPAAVLDIGASISTLAIARDGKPRFIRDISFGEIDITKRLKRTLGLTDQAVMELLASRQPLAPEVETHFSEVLKSLVADLKISFGYYSDQSASSKPVTKLFTAGSLGTHPLLLETLRHALGFSVQPMDIAGKVRFAPGLDPAMIKKNEVLLPVPMGLALRDL